MLDFLRESNGSRNRQHLISQVREMANDVEVIIDTFIFLCWGELESIRCQDFLREVESIRSRFREVNERKAQYPVEEVEDVGPEEEEITPWEVAADEIIMAEEVERLISCFALSRKDDLSIAMLVGLPGSGKTTLARQLYNHPAVISRFDYRLFDPLPSEFKLQGLDFTEEDKEFPASTNESIQMLMQTLQKDLMDNNMESLQSFSETMLELLRDNNKTILGKLCKTLQKELRDPHVESLQMLIQNLQKELTFNPNESPQMFAETLRGKKYFVVFDNVQDVNVLKFVLDVLPREGNSSRVLLTSRSTSTTLGSYVDRSFSMYPWPFGMSWQLFLKMVFPSEYICPRHLKKVGRKIVEKCHGIPLAIKEVGRQLATKTHSVSAWEEFMKSMDFSQTIETMEMSYDRLSSAQKSCFLHMSFYREGTNIRAQKSENIWNAVGMVTRAGQTSLMEDSSRMHFYELTREMMIQGIDHKIDLHIKSFCINGFLHKICIRKAKEEIGFHILGHEELSPPACRSRHRAIHCCREKLNYRTDQDKHLISLFFYGGGNFDATPSYWESFEQLRILDFEGFGLKSLEETVGALRYLALRDNYLQELPHILGSLKNLEVLDIAQNFMIEVSDIIWGMYYIRHLYMSDIICRTPLKMDSMVCLRTLKYISVDNWMYEFSNPGNLANLHELGIEELDENSDMIKLFTLLAELVSLKYLILRGFRFRSMPPLDNLSAFHGLSLLKLVGRLTKLPKLPPHIRCLALVNSCLEEDPMPELEKLPYLCSLKLRNAYTGPDMVFSRHDSMLELLILEELWHLKNLRLEKTFKCRLTKLRISHCPYLDNIPKEINTLDEWDLEQLEMVTTKKIAKGIRQSRIASVLRWDVQPYW